MNALIPTQFENLALPAISDNGSIDRYRGMVESCPHCSNLPAPGARAMQASGDGFWELDLADGSAWFSDWFRTRLHRREALKRAAFHDLRPIMAPEDWDTLLRKVRSHLEECSPLDVEFQVLLAEGRTEWWHMRGSAQRNKVGLPTHFAGCVREVSPSRVLEVSPSRVREVSAGRAPAKGA
jgi:PAS domain-containing protein